MAAPAEHDDVRRESLGRTENALHRLPVHKDHLSFRPVPPKLSAGAFGEALDTARDRRSDVRGSVKPLRRPGHHTAHGWREAKGTHMLSLTPLAPRVIHRSRQAHEIRSACRLNVASSYSASQRFTSSRFMRFKHESRAARRSTYCERLFG